MNNNLSPGKQRLLTVNEFSKGWRKTIIRRTNKTAILVRTVLECSRDENVDDDCVADTTDDKDDHVDDGQHEMRRRFDWFEL